LGVQIEQTRVAAHIHADHRAAVVDDVQMAHDAGAAAVGNDHRAGGARGVDGRTGLLMRFRGRHGIRERTDIAVTQRGPVAKALSVGMAKPGFGRCIEARDRVQARHRHLGTGAVEAGVAGDFGAPQARFEKRARRIRQRLVEAVVAPAIPSLHRDCLCRCS